jgi:hypothetical protein
MMEPARHTQNSFSFVVITPSIRSNRPLSRPPRSDNPNREYYNLINFQAFPETHSVR